MRAISNSTSDDDDDVVWNIYYGKTFTPPSTFHAWVIAPLLFALLWNAFIFYFIYSLYAKVIFVRPFPSTIRACIFRFVLCLIPTGHIVAGWWLCVSIAGVGVGVPWCLISYALGAGMARTKERHDEVAERGREERRRRTNLEGGLNGPGTNGAGSRGRRNTNNTTAVPMTASDVGTVSYEMCCLADNKEGEAAGEDDNKPAEDELSGGGVDGDGSGDSRKCSICLCNLHQASSSDSVVAICTLP